jgi:hypothetical protein
VGGYAPRAPEDIVRPRRPGLALLCGPSTSPLGGILASARNLAEAWIRDWSQYDQTGTSPDPDAVSEVRDLTREDPEAAWDVIVEVLGLIDPQPQNPLFQSLAAGPLEDLLCHHGPRFVGRVEELARRNPNFNLLLGGVWNGGMSPDVWGRLEECRLRTW